MNDQQQTRADARTYTTQPGESVAGIALRQCGSEDEWRNIIALNPEFSEHTACDYFPVGTVLTLPPLPVSRTVAAPIARVQVCGDEITLSATSDQRAVLMTMHDAPIYAEPLSATSANETGAEGLDQFERIDVQNHVLRRTLQRVMARLTDLLDEDQFGNIESIVKEAGVEPPAIAAAAPAEEMIRFCPECGLLGDIPAGYEACCPDWSQARIVPKRFAELCAETFKLCVSQPFPESVAASADERAAFERHQGYPRPEYDGPAQEAWDYHRKTWNAALNFAARAAASPAASIPAGWKLVPIEPTESMVVEGFESWPDQFFSDPEVWAAYEKMTGCQQAAHKARLCYAAMLAAAPQPAQPDAPAEPRELPMMRKAFRVTEVSGDPDPAKQRFYMRFSFPSIEALHAADDEWREFTAAAPAEAHQPATWSTRELELIRQWFDAIQDTNRPYLEPADYALAKRIYEALGQRVPNTINANCKTELPRTSPSADAHEEREPHSDDVAVDSFAAAMKHKLAQARAKGRGGWETCSPADLSRMLREHVEKGDPRDVVNFCMMLWHHGSPIVSAPTDAAEALAYTSYYERQQMLDGTRNSLTACRTKGGAYQIALYTAPPTASVVSLTDNQREVIEFAANTMDERMLDAHARVLRALLNGADHDR
ncbi:tail protein X [Burkholderia multivorans]|uniref:hypothetical protein n=1 Tax=Burkholderia multivorans TaxID=87883 RepID=UPI0021C0E683|nr:hypothetical protein [Burkholderia multivorans]